MELFSTVWNFFFRIMLNALLFLYNSLGRNFALSIVIFTILVRLLTLPSTIHQQKSSRRMQELQPEVQRLQKKYKEDPQKLQEELGKIGYSGMMLSGCLPMLIQLPIWIWLYQSIVQALSNSPSQLLSLSKNIFSTFSHLVPLNPYFLGMDLALSPQQSGNPLGYALVILVVATMWLQQKMMTTSGADPQTAQMNQTMQLTMPLMFGFISLQFASGLALYFVVSNVVGIAVQYFISGWGGLFQRQPGKSEVKAETTGPTKTELLEATARKGKGCPFCGVEYEPSSETRLEHWRQAHANVPEATVSQAAWLLCMSKGDFESLNIAEDDRRDKTRYWKLETLEQSLKEGKKKH